MFQTTNQTRCRFLGYTRVDPTSPRPLFVPSMGWYLCLGKHRQFQMGVSKTVARTPNVACEISENYEACELLEFRAPKHCRKKTENKQLLWFQWLHTSCWWGRPILLSASLGWEGVSDLEGASPIPLWWFPKIGVPLVKPSSYGGTPMTMETSTKSSIITHYHPSLII